MDKGSQSFLSSHDSHGGEPHISDTSHCISVMIITLLSADSQWEGAEQGGVLLASIQMSSAGAGSLQQWMDTLPLRMGLPSHTVK